MRSFPSLPAPTVPIVDATGDEVGWLRRDPESGTWAACARGAITLPDRYTSAREASGALLTFAADLGTWTCR